MAELSKQALKVQNNTEFPNNNAGLITPSKLRGFNVDMIDSLVDEISYMQDSASWNGQIDSLENFTASINAYTGSNEQKWTNLQSFTASITASVQELLNLSSSLSGGYVTQGELADATGSLINQINTKLDSASFNSYTQSTDNRLTNIESTTASINVSIANLNAYTASDDNSITQLEAFTQSANLRLTNLEAATASINSSITNLNSATQSLFTSASLGLTTASVSLNTITFSKGDGSTFNLTVDTGSGGGGSVPAGTISGSAQITALGFVSSSVTASSLVTASASGNTITFTKGDASTFNVTVSGGSGVTFEKPSIETISGSVLITANTFNSGAANLLHISASAQNQANLLFKTNNNAGSTIVSGSLNIYANGSAPAAGRLNYLENSNIFLNESGFLPTVTASVLTAGGFYPRMRNNMWLGTGPWTINTNAFASSSVQAGSYNNNLFLGSTGTTINTLGNTSGPAFSHNIVAQAAITINSPSRSLAQIAAGDSGSTVVSFLNNAAFGGTITYNGPVSASSAQQHTISGNTVQGTLALNLQSGSRGYTISNNILNGTLTVNDNIAFTPTLGANSTISQTNINGAITLTNRASASFNLTANNLGGFTITNEYDSSTNGTSGRSFVFQGNVMLGFLANNIYFSGSAAGTGTANDRGRGFYGNFIGGSRISASVIGDGNRHFLASAVWGQGLSVYGTGLYDASNATLAGGQNGGSAFFGRWNAENGNRANTAETVFAVGTGNSGSAGIVRKTGFLIDSSSNAFFEGNHFISGNTNITDNLIVTGSLTASLQTGYMYVGNAGGLTQAIPTSSLIVETASLATNATDIVVNVKNTTGAQINKGTVVRIIGATGDNALIGTASWTDDDNSANTLGFVVADIPNDGFGRVMTQGTLLGINTDPTLGYTAGQLVYLSSSGQYTNVKPPAPYHEVRLGQVLRAQQNNGSIYVLIQNGYELGELHDVDINTGSLANNDLLAYNSASGQWENKTLTQIGGATTGSNSFAGTQSISGSLVVTGSAIGNVVSMSVSSNTASMDLSKGNYFELTSSASPLRIELSNVQAGVTSTLIVSASVSSSIRFSSNVKQPSPGAYSGSVTASVDILSFVAFNGSTVNLVATKNLI